MCLLDIYHWGAGLAANGRIRDTGQNISNSPIYSQIFFLVAFLEEVFIGYTIIITHINLTL
jgi:hypothetical protein